MKALRILGLIIVMIFFILLTCKKIDDRQKIRNQRGNPDEINTFDSGSYHTETWWYWKQGICYTFKSEARGMFCGGGHDWKIESTYTFEPIKKLNPKIKQTIKEGKLQSEERYYPIDTYIGI